MSFIEFPMIALAIFTIAFVVRLSVALRVQMTWDEGVYVLLGTSYIKNIATRNFSKPAWNLEFHPPIAMYIYGLGYSLYISLISLLKHGFSFNIERLSEEAVRLFEGRRTLVILRLPSIIMGSLCCVLTYLLAFSLTGNNLVGIVAALFLALTPHFIIMTTLVTSDVGVSLFSALSIFLLLVFQGNQYLLIISAIAMGMALGSKETGITLPLIGILFGFLTAHMNLIDMIIWLGIGLLVFYVSWPLLWRNPVKVYREHAHAVLAMPSKKSAGITYYIRHLFSSSPLTLFVLYFAGLFLVVSRELSKPSYLMLVLWALVPLLVMSLPKVPKRGGVSEVLAIIPALSIMAAISVEEIAVATFSGLFIPLLVFLALLAETLRFHPYYMNFRNILGSEKEIPWGWFGEGMDRAMEFIDKNAPSNSTIWIYGPKATAYYYSNRVNTEKSLEPEGLFQMRKHAGFDTSGAVTTTDSYFKQWKKGDLKFFFPYFHTQEYSGFDPELFRKENVSYVVIINWAYSDGLPPDPGNTAIVEELRHKYKPVFTASFKGSEVCWIYNVRNSKPQYSLPQTGDT
jgi:4-amino-4-deoxy-L-arabinose transferase-like glycosyltransferase